jgi:hypothetical protein
MIFGRFMIALIVVIVVFWMIGGVMRGRRTRRR